MHLKVLDYALYLHFEQKLRYTYLIQRFWNLFEFLAVEIRH